jgi:hypothetical protein
VNKEPTPVTVKRCRIYSERVHPTGSCHGRPDNCWRRAVDEEKFRAQFAPKKGETPEFVVVVKESNNE